MESDAPPTFIEIGAAYPSKKLIKIVIWGRDRANFPKPPDALYEDCTIIFTGKPYIYKDLVTVQVTHPDSIRIVEPIENLYMNSGLANEDDADYGRNRSDDVDPVYVKGEGWMDRDEVTFDSDGRPHMIMDLSDEGGETMYWDEDNGWLTE